MGTEFAQRLIAAAAMSESGVIVPVPLRSGGGQSRRQNCFSQQLLQFPSHPMFAFLATSFFLPSFRFPSPTALSLLVRLFYCSSQAGRASNSENLDPNRWRALSLPPREKNLPLLNPAWFSLCHQSAGASSEFQACGTDQSNQNLPLPRHQSELDERLAAYACHSSTKFSTT